MRFVVLCVCLVGCGLDDGYPEAADKPFEKRIPAFSGGIGGPPIEQIDVGTTKPVVDLRTCSSTVFLDNSDPDRPYAFVHPRDDGRTCELWMGSEAGRPPRLYCQYDREGGVRLNVARGTVDRPSGCFPLVTRVPAALDLELALLVPPTTPPARDFEIDLGTCREVHYVEGATFASIRMVDQRFGEAPPACEVYLNNGFYCAFPPYSSVTIERIDGELAIRSTRCFRPEY